MWFSFAPHCMWILYMSFPNVLLYAKHLPTLGQFEDKVTSLDWPLSQSTEQFHNKVSEFCILDIVWTCDISSAKVSLSHSLSFYMQCTKTRRKKNDQQDWGVFLHAVLMVSEISVGVKRRNMHVLLYPPNFTSLSDRYTHTNTQKLTQKHKTWGIYTF